MKNPDNANYGTKGGNDTTDRIFLLSIEETEQYFADDEARKSRPTTYAKNNGADVYEGTAWWWLRSPGRSDISAAGVNTGGSLSCIGGSVYFTSGSVRPAFWLNL